MEKQQQTFDQDFIAKIAEKTMNEIEQCSKPDNFYYNILKNADETLEYIKLYDFSVNEIEKEMALYWFSRPNALLYKLAKHIVDAFLHGFISQSRDINNRKRVRLVYAVGQEALVKAVVEEFQKHSMNVILLKPSALDNIAENDSSIYTLEYCTAKVEAYRQASEKYHDDIVQTCGFIRIGTFGANIANVGAQENSYMPSIEEMKIHQSMQKEIRNIEASLLKPDTLSFCSVVFPDIRVGKERFEALFEEFCKVNTAESEPIELIQADLIDILDNCTKVKLLGGNGNETDITVSLHEIENPITQTLFLNCGGDLNIPHGEMFTTPKLSGTNGVLHVKEIFLKQDFYKDLKLKFSDGIVTEFSCKNFDDEDKNRDYVFEKLFNRTENVPMGELSIGTNTEAYKMVKNYDLFPILPILIAEKLGPHIAVGDPCFARGEDSPVYNIHGGREMIARENEITAKRKECDCYVNLHTDITIPFEDMALFAGVNKDGEIIPIIKDGKFVPECAKALNEALI